MSSAGGYGGGGPKPRPLYGVWIDEALKSNDANQMKEVLQEARKQYPSGGGPIITPLYAAHIQHCIEKGSSREELQQLLDQAKATLNSDLQGAIKKLEQHLGKK